MKSFIRIRRLFFISSVILLPIFLNSCASSSYYERYGSSIDESENSTKISKNITTHKTSKYEDEDNLPEESENLLNSHYIFNKLDHIVSTNKKKKRFLKEIVSFLNTPYKYGGESRKGIDCSAFTQKVYANSLRVYIPRTAREQYRKWDVFKDKSKLKFGDLVYFDTSNKYFPGHVGIYLGSNLFAHASSSKGVIISSLENNYFKKKFVGANRIRIKK